MSLPRLGHGVGLRVQHYERALRGALEVDWIEVVSENFFGAGGRPRAVLEAVRRERPLVFHGVSLGVGSLTAPAPAYLARLRELCDTFEPAWVSDHVCWTRFEGHESHELLPLPFTEEALAVAVENISRTQDALGRVLVLENVSSYVEYAASEMPEWEFVSELARRTGCWLLLDLNNVLVSAHNHGFAPEQYLAGVPADRVAQFHLANHSQREGYRFDDHRGPVPTEVWSLFEVACRRMGPVSSLIEWDEDVPAWEVLVAERDRAARRSSAAVVNEASREQERPAPAQASSDRAAAPQRRGSSGSGRATRSGRWIPSAGPGLAQRRELSPSRASLQRVQRLFFEAMTWPRGVRDFVEVGPEARGAEIEQAFRVPPGTGAGARLEIYAQGYFYRLLAALTEIFPRLAYLMGPAPWHDLITDFVLACPPIEPDLRRAGDRLPEFSRGHAAGERRLLVEVATLELALARALDAPDATPLARDTLAALPAERWPSAEFRLVPSAALLRVAHDLERCAELCQVAERDSALSLPTQSEGLALIVWRRGHAVRFRRLAPLEALVLEQFAGGLRFEQVCASAAVAGAGVEALATLLQGWVKDELLCELAPSSAD